MTRTLPLLLVTLGEPTRLSGGYLYHLRLAEAAPRHGFAIRFAALADRPSFRAVSEARRQVVGGEHDVAAVLLDSIAAARSRLWDALPRHRPLAAIVHQPPGGMDGPRWRRGLSRRLDLSAYRRARLIVAASESLREQLLMDGVEADRVIVVPPGCDPVPQRPAGVGGDLRRNRRASVLCVGNWQRRKDILSLLEAFAMLPTEAATLHLVGDEMAERDYASRVLRRLSASDLIGRVVRHGRCTTAEVAELYAAADVFALPSLVEPYGTVYAEAMAAGLPCVGWQAGNLPNLGTPGQECLTASPGDLVGLSSALKTLCFDEVARKRIGEAARRRAHDFPTWSTTAHLFFSAIHELLQDGGRNQD